jgi:hypothetical protein
VDAHFDEPIKARLKEINLARRMVVAPRMPASPRHKSNPVEEDSGTPVEMLNVTRLGL